MSVSNENIRKIQLMLSSMMLIGISPPRTSYELMAMFGKFGTKNEIIQVFNQKLITWPVYVGAPENYQTIMNDSMIHYLKNT